MSRKTISVSEDVFELVDGVKRDDESWSDVLERLAGDVEPQDGSDELGEHGAEVLTADHIADIAAETSRRTANEVENRLTTR